MSVRCCSRSGSYRSPGSRTTLHLPPHRRQGRALSHFSILAFSLLEVSSWQPSFGSTALLPEHQFCCSDANSGRDSAPCTLRSLAFSLPTQPGGTGRGSSAAHILSHDQVKQPIPQLNKQRERNCFIYSTARPVRRMRYTLNFVQTGGERFIVASRVVVSHSFFCYFSAGDWVLFQTSNLWQQTQPRGHWAGVDCTDKKRIGKGWEEGGEREMCRKLQQQEERNTTQIFQLCFGSCLRRLC